MLPQVKALMERNRCKTLKQLSSKLNISYASMRNRSCGKTDINSKGKYKPVRTPSNPDENIAELVGIILGDGNLNRKDIRIVGNTSEKDYYMYLRRLFKSIFDVESKISYDTANSIRLTVNSVRISKYFTSLGLKIGDKINNKASIPIWIFENKKYLKSCLRGLFDTDGSFFISSNGTEYNILWKMGSGSNLPINIRKALLKLGFNPTKIFGNGRKVALCRKDDIIRFYNEVKPKNNVQIIRYMKITSSP